MGPLNLSINVSRLDLVLFPPQEVLLLEVATGQWLGSDNEAMFVHAWSSLTSADFSHNELTGVDESVVSGG